MKIPKIISRNNREYIFVKAYPNHYLYQDMITGFKECFLLQDLVQIKPTKIIRNIKPENDRFF